MRILILTALFSGMMAVIPAVHSATKPALQSEQLEALVMLQAQNHLSSVRDSKKKQIEDYFTNLAGQVRLLAADKEILEWLKDLRFAFPEYEKQIEEELKQCCVPREVLQDFYVNQVKPEYQYQTGNPVPEIDFLQGFDSNAVALQYRYIAANPNPLWLKGEYSGSADNAAYTILHHRHHPRLQTLVKDLGYADLLLLDNNGTVLYSTEKQADFATSLRKGPYAASALGALFNKLVQSDTDDVILQDFSFYPGAFGAWRSFAGVSLKDKGVAVGMLIVSVDSEAIDAISHDDYLWSPNTFGKSGDVTLVGRDALLRNRSRHLIENAETFFAAVKSVGLVTETTLDNMRKRRTTAGLLGYESPGVRSALSGVTGFDIMSDMRGEMVLSAYAPVDIAGLDWVVLVQMTEAEMLSMIETAASATPQAGNSAKPGPVSLRLGLATGPVTAPWLLAKSKLQAFGNVLGVQVEMHTGLSSAEVIAGYASGRFDAVLLSAAAATASTLTAAHPADIILITAVNNAYVWSAGDTSPNGRYMHRRYLLRSGVKAGQLAVQPPAGFSSRVIPGEIREVLLIRRDLLEKHPNTGTVLLRAWFSAMEKLQGSIQQETLAKLAEFSGMSAPAYRHEIAGLNWAKSPRSAFHFLMATDDLRTWTRTLGVLSERYGKAGEVLDAGQIAYSPHDSKAKLRFNPRALRQFLRGTGK